MLLKRHKHFNSINKAIPRKYKLEIMQLNLTNRKFYMKFAYKECRFNL